MLVVRSVRGAEIFDFHGAFDFGYTFRIGLENIFNEHIQIKMFTESKYVCSVTNATELVEKIS